MGIIERQKELKRRRKRREQLRKFRTRLAAATEEREKERLLEKIHKISPDVARSLRAQAVVQ